MVPKPIEENGVPTVTGNHFLHKDIAPMDESAIESQDQRAPIPLAVGIGASAGGHEALEHIFTALPADAGLSYVVVMHLPPDGPSLLAGLLRRFTAMPVLTIEDGMPLQPDTIHVPPPGRDLRVSGGRFRLHRHEEQRRRHHLIDGFFESLATDLGPSAIAVVLSGFGADGSEGVKKIKEGGGIVLVQDPETAINRFMPQNAIATGAVDEVVSVKAIAERLVHIARGNGAFPPPICLDASIDGILHRLFTLLQGQTGHDFSAYKRKTVIRRIERRMAVNGVRELSEYLIILDKNPEEARALSQELLIGVTNFFRDPQAFELLQDKIIPNLFANRKTEEPLRIWHACCATGEEAYSVAMLILEHLEKEDLQAKVQIFATDLDEAAVAQARAGLYTDDLVAEVSGDRLKRFFTKREGRWQVNKQLREMIVFADHNIIKDPPFSRLDLLVCRNFLIYLNADIQKLLIPLFHQVLNPGGYLFLGSAETVGVHGNLFTPIDSTWKIFVRLGGKTRADRLLPFSSPVRRPADIAYAARRPEAQETATLALADKLVLERYVPARIIINERIEVVHCSRQAGEYLQMPEGKPTKDLLKIAREELRPALRAAIYKAFTEQKEIVYRGINVVAGSGATTINIIVVPLKVPPHAAKQAVVIIEAALPSAIQAPCRITAGDTPSGDSLIHHLEEQLRVTGEQLQSTSEQLETSNERFLLANEELMTVNEELQSTNEELQSTNEELVTVNSELQRKMEELNKSNSDLENLFTSSGIATFFLDRNLMIRHFSPAMADIFNLLPTDIGRSVMHLNSAFNVANLPADVESVLDTLVPVEREARCPHDGRSFIMRVLPYRTTEGVIDGIVVTLVDISERKRTEEALYASERALREGDERLRFALENCHIGAWDLDLEDHTTFRSAEHGRIFGYPELLPEWNLRKFFEHILPEYRQEVEHMIRQAIDNKTGWTNECRIRRADGQIRWIWFSGRYVTVASGHSRVVGVVQDINARKEIEQQNQQLLHTVQEEKDKLSALINGISDEVWYADTHKRFTLINPSALQMFGLEKIDKLDIERFVASLEVFRTDGSLRPVEETPSLLALQGEVVKNQEEIIRHPGTGELRNREVSANPVRDLNGNIIGAVAVVRDITERKRGEEALRRYELLSKHSRDIILFVRNDDGRILEANAAAVQAYGYSQEEILMLTIQDLRAPDTLHMTAAQMLQAVKAGILFATTHRRKDGTTFPVEVSSQGACIGDTPMLLSVVRDITERRRAEEKLQENRAKLEAALASMTDAVFISDSTGRFIEFNDAFAVFHRFESKAACLGKLSEYPEILEVYMAGGELAPLDMWAVPRALRGETVTNAEYTLRRKDTGETWVGSYSFSPIRDNQGAIVGSVVVGRDITELKEKEKELLLSEERRRLALEAAHAGTWEWDVQTNENIWSEELWSLYGLEPHSCKPSYEEWRKIVHSEDRAKTELTINEAVLQALDFTAEWRVILDDGTMRWLMSRGRPVKDSLGNVVRYLGTVMDITERKRAEEENKILQTQLIQAQKMEAIGTLAGGIAHDFNNILGAVIGYAEMAREDSPPGSAIANDLDQVLAAGNRATDLVKQILAFSRQDTTERIPLDPSHLVKETIKLLRPALPSTIAIKQHFDIKLQTIVADPAQIHQIVMNLCTNAFHAMEKTGGVLEISLQERTLLPPDLEQYPKVPAGRFLELSIADTGPGIAKEIRDKIFDPYFTTKEIGKGTGLGLAIVHGIASASGGFVTCESEPGSGAAFHVFFPVVDSKVITATKQGISELFGSEHILLVDDEEVLVKMGKVMLERLGYTVTTRMNSLEALTTFKNQPDQFDAVVTDQTMPGITGVDLARMLLQIRPDIPIILCTGFSTLVNESQARAFGIKEFAMKPLVRKELAALLRKVLKE